MKIIRGDTAIVNITVTYSSGAVFDITDYDFTFTASGAADIVKNSTESDGGIEIIDGPNGLAKMTLTSVDTATAGMYQYDIEITNGTNTFTIAEGYIKIIDDITK